MLKAIKALLVGTPEVQAKSKASSPAGPAGYFMPQSATQLLDMPARKQSLQQLWENSALPKDLYEQFYLQPLHKLVTLMQVLPAAPQGEYAREGGLVDVTLQTTTYAVRLAKGHMLPPGAAPEEQSAQNVQWNVVVFYAALWHYLPLLSQLQGELQSGRAWLPGLTVPSEPYRFRFSAIPPTPTLTTSQSAMIAVRLLPAEVIDWLTTLPAATHSLMTVASRQPGALPVIDEIIQEAVKLARGDSLSVSSAPASSSDTLTALLPSVALSTEDMTSSAPAVDLQSATSSTHSLLVEEQLPAETLNQPEENAASATEVLLSSALDAPVNDKPLAKMVLAPDTEVGVEEDMQALLSLMAVEVSVPACLESQEEGNAPQKESPIPEENQGPVHDVPTVMEDSCDLPDVIEPDLSESADITVISEPQHSSKKLQLEENNAEDNLNAENNLGDSFLQWLSLGVKKGDISINTMDSRAHIVSGFVFLCVPDIFHLYIKQENLERTERNAIQKAFEKLGRHRIRKGQRFFIGHLYQKPEGVGSYRRINGYLVKASSLYGGARVPEDSQLLVIP
ncbi:TraI domain-containing protein [Serratia marcescens]|uniref:TraI domain-containing protein n=1 Tax=Serratia marcescens TaxID=615 RepID=UPI00044AC8F8|nr:TraI domain-containing protein [Serratia marcescens]EIU9509792.1 TraI domain-containing protein [Serratia marcescens]EIV5187667.1 TraI domain-containing protein [Serratia marcescens]ETX44464.1 integrating conjugative element relaxase, PFGI-1 class [Serratia marcescens BIDMC 44]MBH2621413.1 TraI domain-containing protein [Serratia marcescens]MBI6198560.1 TraI domain-containing protein [Serratia marcescens]